MQFIVDTIQQALKTLDIEYSEAIHLEHPADPTHGDYSTNIAMKLFPTVGKEQGYTNPRSFAQAIADKISNSNPPASGQISKVEVAGPGFINFTLSNEWLSEQLDVIHTSEQYGHNIQNKDQKIIVEFTDPNPFKEFHIGHLYSNTVGESIARLLESTGATVRRVCYQGDVGMHVAKSLWGCVFLELEIQSSNDFPDESFDFKKLTEQLDIKMNTTSLNDKVKFLGKSYAKGASMYEEDDLAKQQMQTLNKRIFSKEENIMSLYNLTKQWSLDYFDEIYKRLGTNFEKLYFESEVADEGKQIVLEHLNDGIFEKSDEAIIFPGSKHGLHDRVFINSIGLPTYEAKELGLAPTKYRDWTYDKSIIITGNEINDYFKVLLKALSLVNPELADRTTHLSHGMVRLPEGKMSSRTGKILTGEWLLDEAKKSILEIMKNSKLELTETEITEISEKITIGAIKWALLKQSIGGNIAFSLDESISFEGNSGPYIQYTFARTQSILKKATGHSSQAIKYTIQNTQYKPNSEELAILRTIYQFPEVVSQAASEYSPHLVATYLFNVAQTFNSFYAKHSVLGEDVAEDTKRFRLQLTTAVGRVLKNGLELLGIQAPEKM